MGIFNGLARLFGRKEETPQPVAAEMPVSPEPLIEAETLSEADVMALTAAPSVPLIPKDRRAVERLPVPEGVRVLVIDDSPTIVLMLRRMLEQNGYEAMEANDAETGLEIARNTLPHLIFLDIVLPGMNGFEALRRLRRDPLSRSIPVIMISGNELATEQFYAQRIGADDFMKKPFSRSEVFMRIDKLLGPERIPQRQMAQGE